MSLILGVFRKDSDMSQYKVLFLIFAVVMLSACTKNTVPDPDPTDAVYGDASGSAGSTGGYNDIDGMGGEAIDDPFSGGELGSVIYFDYDSSEVRPEDTDLVSRHALQLADNPGARLRLEGHADERGSREYNIGLGERRAQAVRRLLLIQGATAAQISTVSFGEERPAVEGSDESAYERNRRVEITYLN